MLLYLFRKVLQRSAHVGSAAELGGFKASDDVLESGCHHKILLLKTQLLTLEKLTHTHTHIIKKKGGLKWIFQTDIFHHIWILIAFLQILDSFTAHRTNTYRTLHLPTNPWT